MRSSGFKSRFFISYIELQINDMLRLRTLSKFSEEK